MKQKPPTNSETPPSPEQQGASGSAESEKTKVGSYTKEQFQALGFKVETGSGGGFILPVAMPSKERPPSKE